MDIKRHIKQRIADVVYLSKKCFGVQSCLKKSCRILLYHSVGEHDCKNDKMGLSVPTDIFYMQMKYLKDNGFHVISLPELINKIKNNAVFPDKSIAITFDDGYRNVLTKALPIINNFSFHVTVFINVYFIEKKISSDFYWKRWDILNWEEVLELHRNGIHIGSHALSHRRLSDLNTQELEQEVFISREHIEGRIKDRVDTFSYPHGSFNRAVKDVLKKNNFTSSCTSIEGNIGLRPDIFALRRTEITSFDDTCSRFERKLLGCYDWKRYIKYNVKS